MGAIESLERLTSKGILYTVLIECEAAPGGKSWQVVLSDNHGRKGTAKSRFLIAAIHVALEDLNKKCGNQIQSYLPRDEAPSTKNEEKP